MRGRGVMQLVMDLQEEAVRPHLALVPPPARMPLARVGRPLVKLAEAEIQVLAAMASPEATKSRPAPWRTPDGRIKTHDEAVQERKALKARVAEMTAAVDGAGRPVYTSSDIAKAIGRSMKTVNCLQRDAGVGRGTCPKAKPDEKWFMSDRDADRWAAVLGDQERFLDRMSEFLGRDARGLVRTKRGDGV